MTQLPSSGDVQRGKRGRGSSGTPSDPVHPLPVTALFVPFAACAPRPVYLFHILFFLIHLARQTTGQGPDPAPCPGAGTQYTDVNGGSPSKHPAGETQKHERTSKQGRAARCQVGERLGGRQLGSAWGRPWCLPQLFVRRKRVSASRTKLLSSFLQPSRIQHRAW